MGNNLSVVRNFSKESEVSKSVEARIAIEKKVVRFLCREARRQGWEINYVNDGGERVKCKGEVDVIDAVFSVDESWVRFKKPGPEGVVLGGAVYIVLGNDGWDAIADSSMSEEWDKVMDPVWKYCEALDVANS
jgi:hypothetical protein